MKKYQIDWKKDFETKHTCCLLVGWACILISVMVGSFSNNTTLGMVGIFHLLLCLIYFDYIKGFDLDVSL